jgi:hypothetical protein
MPAPTDRTPPPTEKPLKKNQLVKIARSEAMVERREKARLRRQAHKAARMADTAHEVQITTWIFEDLLKVRLISYIHMSVAVHVC